MANPTIDYSAAVVQGGVNLTINGDHTPNISALYGDFMNNGQTLLANCQVSISYSDVQWTLNNDNSVTVTGNITAATLTRTKVYQGSSGILFNIYADFNGARKFATTVVGDSSGSYNLNFPSSFSITVPPQSTSTAASIHYFNQWTEGGSSPSYQPDEFTVGLIVTNPNLPDYRPGKIWNGSAWVSHNRSAGFEKIYTSPANTREMRTQDGGVGTGNPPVIYNGAWLNDRKIGNE